GGSTLASSPRHIPGFLGMPRRSYTYNAGLGWDGLNRIVTIGGGVFALGTGITLVNWVGSRWRGQPAGSHPSKADTLEWATTSPPPDWNFAEAPLVGSRHPLWDQQPLPAAPPAEGEPGRSLTRVGALEHHMTMTSGLDTRPDDALRI